ncbi:hypothetical protein ACVWYH_001981 [Bradyrhizobium sp. GM24.11]
MPIFVTLMLLMLTVFFALLFLVCHFCSLPSSFSQFAFSCLESRTAILVAIGKHKLGSLSLSGVFSCKGADFLRPFLPGAGKRGPLHVGAGKHRLRFFSAAYAPGRTA